MNCMEFRQRLAGRPHVSDFGDCEEHASECPQCGRILEAERRMADALIALKSDAASAGASPSLESRVLAEFRNHRHDSRARWFILSPSYLRFAFAAAVVVAAGLVAMQIVRKPEDQATARIENAAIRRGTPARTEAEPPAKAEHEPDAVTAARRQAPGRPASAKNVHRAALRPEGRSDEPRAAVPRYDRRMRTYEATEFFPAMRLGTYDSSSDLQLVRVPVSRSALEAFGLAADPRFVNAPVKADVLIGPDGLARAVRFVRERN